VQPAYDGIIITVFKGVMMTQSGNDSRCKDAASARSPQNPVFILGLHRSGTTILYEMLSALKHWNTLWAWHISSYDEIRSGAVDYATSQARFMERLVRNGMETRGVDSIKVGPETKEEYCFVLDNEGQGFRLTKKSFPVFQTMCETIQSTFADERPLLLKNPWDFGNAPQIHELIPSARFVFIHRDPRETISSMGRLMHSVFEKPHPWLVMLSKGYHAATQSRIKRALMNSLVCNTPGLFMSLLTWWTARYCNEFLKSIARLPQECFIEITYDQLCTAPNATIGRIQEMLNVPPSGIDFSEMISPRHPRLDERVAARSASIQRRMKSYYQHMDAIHKLHSPAESEIRRAG